jgi:hypothetical protein
MDDVVTMPISYKDSMTISRGDVSKITGKLAMFFGYAYVQFSCSRASVHSIVIGPRPDDVSKDWVIDHVDRNKLNNTRENLRWVSPSFNKWNCVRMCTDRKTSRFRGVHLIQKKGNQWCAYVMGAHVGLFATEREAAIASATSCIRTYGEWAESSDLLFTADQSLPGALLTFEELAGIKCSIAAADTLPPAPVRITKGSGVSMKRGKFQVDFRRKYLGIFETFAAAAAFRTGHVAAVQEAEWQAYRSLPIARDNGVAVIVLSEGKHASGATSKVDDEFWHKLTFQRKWCVNKDGYALSGTTGMLHKAVMLLIDPNYKPGPNKSIDHADPTAKLDNRRINLRIATDHEQMRNKAPRPGGSSSHVGVYAIGGRWKGDFSYTTGEGPQKFQTPRLQTEKEVVLLLNAKRLEVHGDKAVIDRAFL